jgi:hypothetical protein
MIRSSGEEVGLFVLAACLPDRPRAQPGARRIVARAHGDLRGILCARTLFLLLVPWWKERLI